MRERLWVRDKRTCFHLCLCLRQRCIKGPPRRSRMCLRVNVYACVRVRFLGGLRVSVRVTRACAYALPCVYVCVRARARETERERYKNEEGNIEETVETHCWLTAVGANRDNTLKFKKAVRARLPTMMGQTGRKQNKSVCIAVAETVSDRRTSATGKPPLVTNIYSHLRFNTINQMYYRAEVRAFTYSFHRPASHTAHARWRAFTHLREYYTAPTRYMFRMSTYIQTHMGMCVDTRDRTSRGHAHVRTC